MQQWEYRFIDHKSDEIRQYSTWEACLNYYGKGGWELIQFGETIIFKRPIEELKTTCHYQ